MYYCSVGATKAVGRDVVEAHYKACLYAGVKLGGVNSEVAPAQWEFQVGPCTGIDAADDLWMARYILQRLCELFHIGVTFDPKPVPGWPGIGCHTNYSTKATRALDGLQVMEQHMELLQRRHFDHMAVYGRGNRRRLQGEDSTAKIGEFTWGIGDRSSSVRIGARVAARGCGYYEDRRPASNMDPYEVTRLLVETTLLSAKPVRFAMPSKSFSAGCSPSGPEEPTPEGGEAGTACASCADGMADIAAAPDGCEQVLPYSMAEGREAWA
ncbi:unnamed protein product [Prorocentrum cordatum]|uniref:glutamine synthetase n=1 Tax=Prorocentrum cordatum TaxID=2364126 RepID=A0ABN9XWB6_9DINO|nr:unnamed protein product [Polarella glacialis]